MSATHSIGRPGIDGAVDPGFERVADVFAGIVGGRFAWSGAVAAYVDGRRVVDLWGGPSYREDSLQCVHSVSKGLVSVCLARLIERGALDPDMPMGDIWPEFAAHGKGTMPVRWVLSHQAGLPTVDGGISAQDLFDHDALADRLARQEPLWEPGTRHGYHAITFGTLADELIRRVAGMTAGEMLAREVAQPLGADVFLGLPPAQEGRVVEPRPPVVDMELDLSLFPPLAARVLTPLDDLDWPALYRAGVPAMAGVASARGLATVYAACLDEIGGHRLISDETVATVTREQVNGPDAVIPVTMRFGLGFMLGGDQEGRPPAARMAGPSSFGHDGLGGHLAFADPERRIAFGFVTDQPRQPPGADFCTRSLVDALLACLDEESRPSA